MEPRNLRNKRRMRRIWRCNYWFRTRRQLLVMWVHPSRNSVIYKLVTASREMVRRKPCFWARYSWSSSEFSETSSDNMKRPDDTGDLAIRIVIRLLFFPISVCIVSLIFQFFLCFVIWYFFIWCPMSSVFYLSIVYAGFVSFWIGYDLQMVMNFMSVDIFFNFLKQVIMFSL